MELVNIIAFHIIFIYNIFYILIQFLFNYTTVVFYFYFVFCYILL